MCVPPLPCHPATAVPPPRCHALAASPCHLAVTVKPCGGRSPCRLSELSPGGHGPPGWGFREVPPALLPRDPCHPAPAPPSSRLAALPGAGDGLNPPPRERRCPRACAVLGRPSETSAPNLPVPRLVSPSPGTVGPLETSTWGGRQLPAFPSLSGAGQGTARLDTSPNPSGGGHAPCAGVTGGLVSPGVLRAPRAAFPPSFLRVLAEALGAGRGDPSVTVSPHPRARGVVS